MSGLVLSTLDDGCVKVCLSEEGITACCIVSSHHLVEEKERQLRQAIIRTAVKSLTE